jgi:hypothetical protein
MDERRIKRSAKTGAWLTTLPNLLNGSDLSADEFRDGTRLRLGLTPTTLPRVVMVAMNVLRPNMPCPAAKAA